MGSVSVRDVTIAFGPVSVFDRLSIDVANGEFLVLLGPSGCGKSTLLNAIAGLAEIDDGQIWIDGRNVTWEEPKDRGIAMVFQSYALYPRMSVRQNMSFGLRMARMPSADIAVRVKRAADLLRIEHLLDRTPDQLSGGQRQRVAIGRALVRDAAVFLFDEPLSNLDAELRNELRVEIKRLHAQLGDTTMIYVTHDQIEALTLADRIAVMKDRVIQQLGTPQEIYHRPVNRFVAGFVGAPRMNFIDGRIETEGGAPVFAAGDRRLPLDVYPFTRRPEHGAPVSLGVRPEHVAVGTLLAAMVAWPHFVVDVVEPMGADNLVWCTDGQLTVEARLMDENVPRRGDRLTLGIDPSRISLFAGGTGERL